MLLSAEAKADVLLLTALDEIAWLCNLRGSDVSYNPVFLSYATVTEDGAKLFVDEGKVRENNLHAYLHASKQQNTHHADARKMMILNLTLRCQLATAGHEIYRQPN